MAIKQNLSIGEIEGLTESQIRILKALAFWNYQLRKANVFNLKRKLDLSESTVIKAFREFKERGFVTSSRGSYMLNGKIKQQILDDLIEPEEKTQEKKAILEELTKYDDMNGREE